MKLNSSIFMFCIIFLVGCARTEYNSYAGSKDNSVSLSRSVKVYLNPTFKEDPPQCVLVFQPRIKANPEFLKRIEKALVRHLSEKFNQVISGKSRDSKAAKFAFDLAIPSDRYDFAKQVNCGSVFEFQINQPKHHYAFVWSEIRIGLQARLIRQRDGLELWKARHVARRSDGGVSLSPIELAVNAYYANAFSLDEDVIESVIEDLARRLLRSIPEVENTRYADGIS